MALHHLTVQVSPSHVVIPSNPYYTYPMTITQTVEVPVDRRLTIEVPRDIPTGPVVLTFTPAADNGCPICAGHRNPQTGELRFNAETVARMKEVDDMIAGKTPNTLRSFSNLEEMMADLDSDD